MRHEPGGRHRTVVTETATTRCDVGVDGGRIAALGEALPPGRREVDATVLPGGIDSHCHLEQVFDRSFERERRRKRGEIHLLDAGTPDQGVTAS